MGTQVSLHPGLRRESLWLFVACTGPGTGSASLERLGGELGGGAARGAFRVPHVLFRSPGPLQVSNQASWRSDSPQAAWVCIC